ncbi:ABC transporter type 1, transmembrane domain-containing protein [Umbelopsis sp. PMI_123]|nr:ABC transporter type 1, transmembrane domain-containing protein [Umbelopsis sp. PMI_123]
MGTIVVYNTLTHARQYHTHLFCEASVHNDPKFQPMAISMKHVDSLSTESTSQNLKSPSLWVEIWRLVKPDLLLLILVAFTAVGAAVVNLQTPTVTGELIDVIARSIKGAGALSMEDLKKPAVKLLGLFLSQGFLTFSHISLVSTLGENVASRLKSLLFSAIVKQDISFFDSHKSGELVGRLTTDVADFKHTFKQIVTQGLKSIAQTIGSAIHLMRISPSLTFTLLATMPALYGVLNIYGTYLRKLSKEGKELDGIASGLAGELIANVRTVRAFAAEERECERYQSSTDKVAKANTYLGLHIGLFQGMTNAAIGCMALIVLYYGGSLVVKNEMTGGDLMTYMLSTQSTQRSLVSLGVLFGQSIKAIGSATRVFEFVHATPNVPLHGGATLEYLDGNIRFDNVSFHYPTRREQQVLENFTLDIPQGNMVALCGPSGSGKSTVAALLERFYEPCDGQILIDGTPLHEMDPSWIRQQIGFINQEPVLFAASIADNIRYGNPNATDEEVRSAARKANAETFIEAFPDGYDTMVGERGTSLSGGQKQRVAIARAILKNPKVRTSIWIIQL